MLRKGLVVAVACALACAGAYAHEVVDNHNHEHATQAGFPVVEVLSGLALILAAGSFWMSVRTRQMLLRGEDTPCGP